MSQSGGEGRPSARPGFADLGPRLASAAVLLVVTIAAVWLGGIWFALVTGIAFALLYREWEIMISLQAPSRSGLFLTGIVALLPLAATIAGPWASFAVGTGGYVIALLFRQDLIGWRLIGLSFVGLVIVSVVAVRGDGLNGFAACFFLGTAVWMTDTGAFFAGRQFGGAKLNPEISPAKTWSGAIGGLIIGSLAGLAVWHFAAPDAPWWIGLCIAAGISVMGQLGDLSESALKRHFRIKDSGDIIPGHGGLMDRLDSLTFGAIFVFVLGVAHSGLASMPNGLLVW